MTQISALDYLIELKQDRDAYKQSFENAVKRADEHFQIHETFLVKLCKILKIPYENTEEEEILEVVKNLMETR